MNQCVKCGTTLRADSRFCANCGTQQPPATAEGQAAPTTMLSARQAFLEVRDSDGSTFQVPLGSQPLSFGRAADNSIIVQSRFVSSYHARIEPDTNGHQIIDLGSTNGLLFNGVRVPRHDFHDGESVRIGDPVTGSFVTLIYHNNARPATQAALEPVTHFELTAPVIPIGREGALRLDNPQVSRRHAEIRAESGGHVLRDLGSTNGTFVNGERISVRPLRPGDVIQIGPYKLVYDGRSLDQFDQGGAMRIDGRSLVRIVGGGRIILHNVSLVIRPREFVAVVGGSGAGKSTLVGALSGYNRADKGAVLVNGDDFYANFDAYRTVLGYVPQDDILHRSLPVETALRYTAKLRLPVDTAPAEIEQRIERVLDDVEMSDHRTKRVDQLSGGQRKRVSISSELLADPSLFFLDEPTSGLDPGLEKKMMFTLRRLADSGRTIVLITHATANITQCDHVVFMADGRMVWFGPPMEALQFFNVTSGDFADIYTKLEGRADDSNPLTHTELQQEYAVWRQHHPQTTQAPMLAELWEIRFRHSPQYRQYVWERLNDAPQLPTMQQPAPTPQPQAPGAYPATNVPSSTLTRSRPKPPPVSALRQWWILTRRYARLIAADRRNLMILLLQAPIIGLILLLVAEENSLQRLSSANGRMVPFLLGTVAVWFGIINSVREITKEEAVYKRERLANLKIIPYLTSKVTILSLFCLLQSLVLMVILATEVDFGPEAVSVRRAGTQLIEQSLVRDWTLFGHWGGYLITTFLTSLTGLGLGLLISALVNTSDKAMSIVPFALVPQIVFALALLPLPAVIAPLSFLVGSRWAMDGYGSITQFLEPRDPAQNFEVYPTVNYDPTNTHVLFVWTILIVYTLVCLGATAWILRTKDQD